MRNLIVFVFFFIFHIFFVVVVVPRKEKTFIPLSLVGLAFQASWPYNRLPFYFKAANNGELWLKDRGT